MAMLMCKPQASLCSLEQEEKPVGHSLSLDPCSLTVTCEDF